MRAFRAMAGAVLTAAVVLVATAAPAAAHDELISSTPTSGQQLETAPADVQLTFSADVLTIGAAVIVVDASEQDWADGAPQIQGGLVTAPLRTGMPAGGYEIRGRVGASEGHPIRGVGPVTGAPGAPVAEPSPTGQTTTDQPTSSPAPSGQSTSAAADTAADSTGSDDGSGGGALRVLLVGLAGAAIAVAVYLVVRARRGRTGSSGDPRS